MGKSPAKWIKVLFGKKSSRSNSTKKGAIEKANTGGKGPACTEASPVISDPVLVTAHSNGATTPTGANEETSGTQAVAPVTPPITNQEVDTQRVIQLDSSENQEEKIREEKAAVKAQAAFRGYLARRAFKALKGIIRLQALIRGHLVRRQAVASLRAIHAIVRFQALVRGNIVRSTNNGLGTHSKRQSTKGCADTWKQYSSANAFARKLVSFDIKVEPLHFQYDVQDPNCVLSWLPLWTAARPWKPISPPKKNSPDAKPATRRSSYAMETESGKLKRNARKNPANANNDSSQVGTVNSTRNPKKLSAPPSESAQESSPLTELEKVKRNLRKVSSSVQDSSVEIEAERTSISVPRNSNADHSNGNLIEKAKRYSTGASAVTMPEIKPNKDNSVPAELTAKEERETTEIIQNEKPEIEEQIGNLTEAFVSPVEEKPLEEVVASNEETPVSHENYKTTKRRSSLSIKPEHTENNNILVQNNSPSVPSYMAMTASAKTKLRGQASPRFGSDQGSGEKNVSTRRHSLPTSTNDGKLSSHSPRTQRPLHAKGGAKNDKSMHSSRDGSEKPIVEWRR